MPGQRARQRPRAGINSEGPLTLVANSFNFRITAAQNIEAMFLLLFTCICIT